jgi:hypothetical protein
MAFTRFHDDPARISKQLQQMTDTGRWILNVPGNGDKPDFALDPQIIPQKWGANLWTNSIDISSSLLGIDKSLNRDVPLSLLQKENPSKIPSLGNVVKASSRIEYPVCDSFLTTDQSRVIMPAWTARDLPQNHAYILPNDPQLHTELPFDNYTSTRILEKDYFQRPNDCSNIMNRQEYTVIPKKENDLDPRQNHNHNMTPKKTKQ